MKLLRLILLSKPFRKFYLRHRYKESIGELIEVNYLINRHARRCNYDFKHCVGQMSLMLSDLEYFNSTEYIPIDSKRGLIKYHRELQELFEYKSTYWENVFDPADDGKLYRTKWQLKIYELEREIDKYKQILKENNLEHLIPIDDAPF